MIETINTCTKILSRNKFINNEQYQQGDLYEIFKELQKKNLITEKELQKIETTVI